MTDQALAIFEVSGGIATLTLNDPQRLNALTEELLGGCVRSLEQIRGDPKIRALVVKARGRAFCCGADLADFSAEAVEANSGSNGERVYALMRDYGDAWIKGVRSVGVPVVCAVQGAVAGGGVGFALAADIVIAARSAYFYLPFVPSLGLVPDMASMRFISRSSGEARAVGAALLGDKVPAERAAAWGLVWSCVDDERLEAETAHVAQRLAQLPPGAILEIRELTRISRESSLEDQLAHERNRQRALMDSPTFAEGARAFAERRMPRFRP